jgi:hypothetical protein
VERAADLVEPQVVDAHYAPTVDVDDLAVEQILAQQDLVGALLEHPDVDGPGVEHDAVLVERLDSRPGQEDPAARGLDDQTRDRRIAIADGHDEVVHLADGFALPIAHGSPHDPAQVVHLPPRSDGVRLSG